MTEKSNIKVVTIQGMTYIGRVSKRDGAWKIKDLIILVPSQEGIGMAQYSFGFSYGEITYPGNDILISDIDPSLIKPYEDTLMKIRMKNSGLVSANEMPMPQEGNPLIPAAR